MGGEWEDGVVVLDEMLALTLTPNAVLGQEADLTGSCYKETPLELSALLVGVTVCVGSSRAWCCRWKITQMQQRCPHCQGAAFGEASWAVLAHPWRGRAACCAMGADAILALPHGSRERGGERQDVIIDFWWRCIGLPHSAAETLFARLPN